MATYTGSLGDTNMNTSEYSLLKTAYYSSGISDTEKTANVLHKTIGGGALGAVTGALAGRGVGDGTGGNYSGTGLLLGGVSGALGGRHHGKVVQNLGKTQKDLVRSKDNYRAMSGMFDDASAANKSLQSDLKATQGALDLSTKNHLEMLAQRNLAQDNLVRQADKYTDMAQRVGRRNATIADLEKQVANHQQQLKQTGYPSAFANNPPAKLTKTPLEKLHPAPTAPAKNVAQTKPLPEGATGWSEKGEPIFKRGPNDDFSMDEIRWMLTRPM